MMEKISEEELMEILGSYGVSDASFFASKRVTPDSMVYAFADEKGANYVLYAADYLGGYENLDLPHDFEFDDGYPYSKVSFRAVRVLSYADDAKKKAESDIDENHYWTRASTGDVCMLFAVDELKMNNNDV